MTHRNYQRHSRADFERFSATSESLQTEVWREVDSNYRHRFLNWQTTAFRRRLQHRDESRSAGAGRSENRGPADSFERAGGVMMT
jgi:hypothetical protein